MTTNNIFQIYYNSKTKEENDQGFLQLDNLFNQRPDWAEYWPIRNYLLNNKLEENTYYGFLSPKFQQKTGLHSSQVFEFLNAAEHDVVVFSPYFDQSAFAINIFEQAAVNHEGMYPCFIETFKALGSEIDIQNLVMTSKNTVFCNYFAAKKSFWEAWFALCEKLFAICEEDKLPLAKLLNASVSHGGGAYQSKVFIIERIASFLLATSKQWSVKAFNPMYLPYAASPIAQFKRELCEMDALKMAYCDTGFMEYIGTFHQMRNEMVSRLQS